MIGNPFHFSRYDKNIPNFVNLKVTFCSFACNVQGAGYYSYLQ
jgi:hypothetical protein